MDARVCSLSTRQYFWAGGQPQAPSGHPLLVIKMAQCHRCMGLLSYIREGLLDQELFAIAPVVHVLCDTTDMLMVTDTSWDMSRWLRGGAQLD